MRFHYLSACFLGFALLCAAQVGFAKDEGKSAGAAGIEKATFAGGCFWCMVPPFDNLPGVVSVTSGYTGGHKENPTYEEVSGGTTGHAESVQIVYDPSKIGYGELLDIFWHNIDPLARDRQFCDEGNQYRSAIFFHNEEQSRLAEASKKVLEESPRFKGTVIYTGIVPASEFYPAEAYHQKYYKTHSLRYKAYRYSCGRDQRLKEIWGKQPH
jgi:peptide-methionine (S)-S-oxide reductase